MMMGLSENLIGDKDAMVVEGHPHIALLKDGMIMVNPLVRMGTTNNTCIPLDEVEIFRVSSNYEFVRKSDILELYSIITFKEEDLDGEA